MKNFLYLLAFLPCVAFAQNNQKYDYENFRGFGHMEVGAVIGSTGIGADLSIPLSKNVKLRAGFSAMPKLSSVGTYSMTTVGGAMDEEKTKKLATYLGDLINNKEVDDLVDMDRTISYRNAKVILDWYPFKQKNWHFSAGFYWGSKSIGKARNTMEEAPTMLAMIMYNNMYDEIQHLDEYEYPTFSFGSYFFELDPVTGKQVKASFNWYGRSAVQLGSFDDGRGFYIDPDKNGILKADAMVNAFKPYIGLGYNKCLGSDKRWNIGFDAGLLFWKTPHIYCNGYTVDENNEIQRTENICLVHDVKGIKGVVGNYVNFAKHLPILPVLELKLAYSFSFKKK